MRRSLVGKGLEASLCRVNHSAASAPSVGLAGVVAGRCPAQALLAGGDARDCTAADALCTSTTSRY